MRSPEGVDGEGEPASWQRFWRLLPETLAQLVYEEAEK